MDLFAHIAQLAGKHQFHLRVDILYSLLDDELAFLGDRVDRTQFFQEELQFLFCQQANAFQHGDMSHRAQYVVRSQVKVHLTVLADSKQVDLMVDLYIFFPKFLSHCFVYIDKE